MRWLKRPIQSIYGILATPEATHSVLEDATEDVRESMLAALGASAPQNFPQIVRRIRYASDINSLWYLRGELMAILAGQFGEVEARNRVASITAQFKGLLPGGLSSRPSPLVN